MDLEELVDIKNYEGLYKVNRKGDVWSCKRKRLLKPELNTRGYYRIVLCKDGKAKKYSIHRLIAINFIPNPENLPCIDHINRVRSDNRIENLRWITHKDNSYNSSQTINRKDHIEKKKVILKKKPTQKKMVRLKLFIVLDIIIVVNMEIKKKIQIIQKS